MKTGIRLAIVAVALVAAHQAAAVGPWLWTVNGGPGIADSTGAVRYVARIAGPDTTVDAIRQSDGARLRSLTVAGHWGLQAATMSGALTGLSGDGRLLVLTPPTRGEPVERSPFVLIRTADLAELGRIELRGDFTVDALSPSGRTLFLIQHLAGNDAGRYQVRAYDIPARTLLPQVIADKRQAGWTMLGYPVARAATVTGSRVYTLYSSGRNYPFVHALDTVGRTAVCIGLPLAWRSNQILSDVTLTLSRDGRTLRVGGGGIANALTVDTRTFKVSRD